MEISLEDIATAVIAILIAGGIQQLLPERITDVEPLALANSPWIQIVVVAVILFYVISGAASILRRKFGSTSSRSASAFVTTIRDKPRYNVTQLEFERFGVMWRVFHGQITRFRDPYAWVDSAFCPDCGTDLMTDDEERRFRSDRKIWKCPACGFKKERPDEFLYDEREAVERMAESHMRNQRNP